MINIRYIELSQVLISVQNTPIMLSQRFAKLERRILWKEQLEWNPARRPLFRDIQIDVKLSYLCLIGSLHRNFIWNTVIYLRWNFVTYKLYFIWIYLLIKCTLYEDKFLTFGLFTKFLYNVYVTYISVSTGCYLKHRY